jgi:hypothetical protein
MMRSVEKRLQMAAHRMGLRVIADRRVTEQNCYLLGPALDARRVVQILPDGNYCLASLWENGRRYSGIGSSLARHWLVTGRGREVSRALRTNAGQLRRAERWLEPAGAHPDTVSMSHGADRAN